MGRQAYTIAIKNCLGGTAAWHHEKRHEWQEEKFGVLSFSAKWQFIVWTLCFALLWGSLQFVGLLLFSAWYLLEFACEADAVVYSIRKVGVRRWLKES